MPPFDGQGGRASGFRETRVGVLVARGVGVDRGAVVGAGVGFGVGFAVGAGVGWAVGRGLAVRPGVGAADAVGVGPPGVTGAVLGVGVASGTIAMPVGLAAGDVDGDAAVDGEADAIPGDELGTAEGGVVGGAAGVCVGTTATGPDGSAEGIDRSRNSTPPMPRAIVARTRFRTPRLRMSRAR